MWLRLPLRRVLIALTAFFYRASLSVFPVRFRTAFFLLLTDSRGLIEFIETRPVILAGEFPLPFARGVPNGQQDWNIIFVVIKQGVGENW